MGTAGEGQNGSQDFRGHQGRRGVENKKGVTLNVCAKTNLYSTLCLFALTSSRVGVGRPAGGMYAVIVLPFYNAGDF